MQKENLTFLVAQVILLLAFTACSLPEKNDPFAGITKRDMVSITGGTYYQTSFDHTISDFSIGKYEVTYELWYLVHNWALSNGYTFANPGREGNDGTIADPQGAAPTTGKYEPVTTISWRDAIVWCNAYSQMAGLAPCYTYSSAVIKDSRDTNATACNNAVCNWSANGYRVPTEGEWQYAASNKGGTPDNYASGAAADVTDFAATSLVAWFGNSTTPPNGNTTSTRDVGTTTNSSTLTLYDVSGNVYEWCWDLDGAYPVDPTTDYRGPAGGTDRVFRGGSWDKQATYMRVGLREYDSPTQKTNILGFRVTRTY